MKGDIVYIYSVKLTETTSSCYVPSVHEGFPSTLTCRFSADVNLNKRNVHVVHIDGEGREGKNSLAKKVFYCFIFTRFFLAFFILNDILNPIKLPVSVLLKFIVYRKLL